MNGFNRRIKERSFRQALVMNAAETLFIERGFERTTMDDIAREAELSKSTLYKYFSSKDELMYAMHLRDQKIGYERVKAAETLGNNGIEKLHSYGMLCYAFYRDNPTKLLLRSYLDFKSPDPDVIGEGFRQDHDRHNQRELELLLAIFDAGKEDGTIRPDLDVFLAISLFIYTLHPIAKQSLFSTQKFASFESESYFESYLRHFLCGFEPQSSKE